MLLQTTGIEPDSPTQRSLIITAPLTNSQISHNNFVLDVQKKKRKEKKRKRKKERRLQL